MRLLVVQQSQPISVSREVSDSDVRRFEKVSDSKIFVDNFFHSISAYFLFAKACSHEFDQHQNTIFQDRSLWYQVHFSVIFNL